MCDIAEEVARFYGYASIPMSLPSGAAIGGLSTELSIDERCRHSAEALGYSQAYLYSFESPKACDRLLLPEDAPERRQIRIQNPLGEDFSVLRTSSANGMLGSLSTNFKRKNRDIRLYEMANVYLPKSLPLTELPDERMQLTLGAYGDCDFFSVKGDLELILNRLGLKKRFHYDAACPQSFLHPGRRADILYEGRRLGYLGELHPEVLENYGIGERAYLAVLDMKEVYPFVRDEIRYLPLAKFPSVSRDFSMLVPLSVTAGEIEDVLIQRSGKLLEELKLFDIYIGAQVLSGYKSMAYTLTLRAKDHTLTEEEINAVVRKVLDGLNRLGIRLRD